MTQETFPEIQAATAALENARMKETMAGKKRLVRGWRKAISAVSPKPAGQKKKTAVSAS